MFIFDATNIISYNEYVDFISNLKKRFDTEKEILFDIYNIYESTIQNEHVSNYIEFRNKYRELRQNIINETIKKFRNFLPRECLIYEFGSLAKFTDRIESDVDLTFCYDDIKNDIFECAEELINYSITYVFEHSIDHIHGKFQHYPITNNYNHLTEKDNIFILKFGQEHIKYKCGPETIIENIMGKKNVRNYQSLLEGYVEKYVLRCDIECLYSIIIIENSTKHDFINDLIKLEKKYDIFLDYKFNYNSYCFDDNLKISYIKKSFKNSIVSMYIMISFLRKRLNWLKSYSMNMDDFFHNKIVSAFLGEKYICELRSSFINMIFYWDKIELLLKEYNILLSSRSQMSFAKQELDNMLYKKYHERNLLDKILKSINNLNALILDGWHIINEQ